MHFQAPKKTGRHSVTKFTPATIATQAEAGPGGGAHTARLALAVVLAGALAAASFATQAQQAAGALGGQGPAPRTAESSRPAPVSGRIGADPAAVALRPATHAPAQAVSTATPVAPPKHLNEPLLSPVVPETSAFMKAEPVVRKPLHVDHTKGTRKPTKVRGKKHEKTVVGKPHGPQHHAPAKGNKHGAGPAAKAATTKSVGAAQAKTRAHKLAHGKAGSKVVGTGRKAAGHTLTASASTRQHAQRHDRLQASTRHAKATHAPAMHTQAPAPAAHMAIAPSRPTPRHRQVD